MDQILRIFKVFKDTLFSLLGVSGPNSSTVGGPRQIDVDTFGKLDQVDSPQASVKPNRVAVVLSTPVPFDDTA